MDSDIFKTLAEHFSILEDPRDPRRHLHSLIDMLIIAITAVNIPASFPPFMTIAEPMCRSAMVSRTSAMG